MQQQLIWPWLKCMHIHHRLCSLQFSNDFLKVSIGGHSETQLVPKLLLQVSVWELHNSMVSTSEEGGLKEERDAYNNIIISISTL